MTVTRKLRQAWDRLFFTKRSLARLAFCAAVIMPFSLAAETPAHRPSAPHPFPPLARDVTAAHMMVVTANPFASRAALDVLKAGGNAIDAAVTAQAMLSLVEPQSSGLGGGAFLLYYDAATRQVTSWDGRETAPAAIPPTIFQDATGKPLPLDSAGIGGRAVGVPGALRMLEAVHKLHGQLLWKDLFTSTITQAENGFPVSALMSREIREEQNSLMVQEAARTYFLPNGSVPEPGYILKNPALAETMRSVAEKGADALLTGRIATDIVAAIRQSPASGTMTMDDLASYQPRQRPALCMPVKMRTVCSMGPPSSGGVAVLQILSMLEGFDLRHLRPDSAEAADLIIQAEHLAFADRNLFLADPDFVKIPLRGLLDPAYLRQRARMIHPRHALSTVEAGNPSWSMPDLPPAQGTQPPKPEHGTSHISIVDAQGNAVSMTTTVQDVFGSKLLVDGFILNDELTDFAFVPEEAGKPVANRVQAGKRPRSSMAPIIVLDQNGKLDMVTGSPGGGHIISYVSQAMLLSMRWNLSPAQAISAPHIGTTGLKSDLEAGTEATLLADRLLQYGHHPAIIRLNSGLSMIIKKADGHLTGAADPRRDGIPYGE
ncbi:Gamma-glutamyltranspeptidase [Granulibacter bethesdensis]|nr:Gamma-glutamyltranspeptidase [Granulibacter bethesdensis]